MSVRRYTYVYINRCREGEGVNRKRGEGGVSVGRGEGTTGHLLLHQSLMVCTCFYYRCQSGDIHIYIQWNLCYTTPEFSDIL